VKVILVENVTKLGYIGDEVEVKDGYARNFLLPSKLAVKATAGAANIIAQKKKMVLRQEMKKKEDCEQVAETLKEVSCTINVESGEEDKLFGSVTTEMIADTLLADGINIDRKKIVMEEPIKKLGVYNVDIKLHPEVKAQIRVWVVKK
jgi:large subunit ribosomal protein L9